MPEINPLELRAAIAQTKIQCKEKPEFFMKEFCYIQHPKKGRVKFVLYPFQAKVLNLWKNHRYSIVLKSRQLGISTLAAGYALWLMLFQDDKNVLCLATKSETAKNMVTKVHVMYDNLPKYLAKKATEKNKFSIRLENGSQIKAVSAAGDAGRSEAVSLLLIDEAAFIDEIEMIWASAQQTLGTGGQCIAMSTPNGTGNWFHKTWVSATLSENDFLPIKLDWRVHPERDEKWRKEQDDLLGIKLAAQECDAEFLTSGDTVISPESIQYYENMCEVPLEKRGFDKNYHIWKYADANKKYAVIADTARGDGKDYSAFHVIDLETLEQVASYKGQLDTTDFGRLLVSVATEYNMALLIIENSNVGWSTVKTVMESGYLNIYHTPKNEDAVASYSYGYEEEKGTPGFSTNLKTRPLIVMKIKEAIDNKLIIIKDKRTVEELKTFIWKSGRGEAQSGFNDDLTMALGIGLYTREAALRIIQNETGVSNGKMLDSIIVTSKKGPNFSFADDNPYHMSYGETKIDISWLLQ